MTIKDYIIYLSAIEHIIRLEIIQSEMFALMQQCAEQPLGDYKKVEKSILEQERYLVSIDFDTLDVRVLVFRIIDIM